MARSLGFQLSETMAASLHTAAEEAHGAIEKAQGHLPQTYQPTCGEGDSIDQSHPAWLGALLPGRALQSSLLVYQRVRGKEDSAASDAQPETQRPRLEAMERQ